MKNALAAVAVAVVLPTPRLMATRRALQAMPTTAHPRTTPAPLTARRPARRASSLWKALRTIPHRHRAFQRWSHHPTSLRRAPRPVLHLALIAVARLLMEVVPAAGAASVRAHRGVARKAVAKAARKAGVRIRRARSAASDPRPCRVPKAAGQAATAARAAIHRFHSRNNTVMSDE